MVERLWYLWRILPQRAAGLERHWLRRSDRSSVASRYVRQAWLSVARQRLERFMPLIRVLIALCPLLGLLGTVSGMIQVFDVLSVSGTGNPRAMAGGVSRATVPTMAGMAIAISGLLCLARFDAQSRLAMQRLSDRLRHELETPDMRMPKQSEPSDAQAAIDPKHTHDSAF